MGAPPRNRAAVSLACAGALGLLLGGCGPTAPSARPPVPAVIALPGVPTSAPSEPAGRFRCEVEVAVLGPEVVGEAKREGNGDLDDEAWQAACAALRARHGIDCEDEGRVAQVARHQQISLANGTFTQSLRIVLRPMLAPLRGQASADGSPEQACRRAADAACRQAPKDSECDGAGAYCQADRADPSLWRCSPEAAAGAKPLPGAEPPPGPRLPSERRMLPAPVPGGGTASLPRAGPAVAGR